MKPNGAGKFSPLFIALHWLVLALMVAVYVTMEFRGMFPKGSDPREAMKNWHYMLGLSVFVLVWLRLVLRLIYPYPAIHPLPPKWQTLLASAVHIALFAFMIAMPLLGWMSLSAGGKPVLFAGLQLPALIAENKPLAKQLHEIHETIGLVGYYLIGLHAAAALFHHYFMRDNTLRRMSPFKSH